MMKNKRTYFIIVFLIIASLAAHGRILNNDFINYDDPLYITDNDHVRSGINSESIRWAFTSFVSYNWHPLTWLSIMLDWSLFGENASGHHLMSLLLHIGAVVLLFLFFNKTTKSPWSSAFVAAFFALHPLRVESVAWASERKDVLSMFFGMASLYAYAFYAESKRLSRYSLCLILFAMSLLSKSMMVTLPFVFLLLDVWPLGRLKKTATPDRRKAVFRIMAEKTPFLFLTIISSVMTVWAQYQTAAVRLSFPDRVANAVISYAAYLKKMLWPFDLAVFYPFVFTFPAWKILMSLFILTVITVAAVRMLKKTPFLFSGWFWYLGTLFPVIGLVPINAPMADRYTYLPSIGIAIMLAWGFPYWMKSEPVRKKILLPAGMMMLVIFIALTWTQSGYWKDNIRLYGHTLRVTENNDVIHNNLGRALFEKGRWREALYHYDHALRIFPAHEGYYNNRGDAYAAMGLYEKAIENYNTAIRLNHRYADAFYNRGTAYGKFLQSYEQAIRDFDETIRLEPDYFKAYNNRGAAYLALGRYQQAIQDFSMTLKLRPGYLDGYHNRAVARLLLGEKETGCADARRACESGRCGIWEAAQNKGICRPSGGKH